MDWGRFAFQDSGTKRMSRLIRVTSIYRVSLFVCVWGVYPKLPLEFSFKIPHPRSHFSLSHPYRKDGNSAELSRCSCHNASFISIILCKTEVPRELFPLSIIYSGTNYSYIGGGRVGFVLQHLPGKQNLYVTVLGRISLPPSLSLLNTLISIPYPKANNLQTIRSLSAPFQMGRLKRESIAILYLFSSKRRQAGRQAGIQPLSLAGIIWTKAGNSSSPP